MSKDFVAKNVGFNNLEEEWTAQILGQKGEDAQALVHSVSDLGGVFEQVTILSSSTVITPQENHNWLFGSFQIEGEQPDSFFCVAVARSAIASGSPSSGGGGEEKETVSKINALENSLPDCHLSKIQNLTHCADADSLIEELGKFSGFENALLLSSQGRPYVTQHPPRCEYGVFEIESESENNKWLFVVLSPAPQSCHSVPFASLFALSTNSTSAFTGLYSRVTSWLWRQKEESIEEEKDEEEEAKEGEEEGEEEGEGEGGEGEGEGEGVGEGEERKDKKERDKE